ncbi:hypothetical protein PHYNN_146 [Pantoea phage Phynn]|nr:hypothetical protein PHYNN_146 [Pantoea phage Phynn]
MMENKLPTTFIFANAKIRSEEMDKITAAILRGEIVMGEISSDSEIYYSIFGVASRSTGINVEVFGEKEHIDRLAKQIGAKPHFFDYIIKDTE